MQLYHKPRHMSSYVAVGQAASPGDLITLAADVEQQQLACQLAGLVSVLQHGHGQPLVCKICTCSGGWRGCWSS